MSVVGSASSEAAPIGAARAAASGIPREVAAVLVVVVWLAVGLLSASQYYLAAWTVGQPGAWGAQLLREVPPWQVWSLLTPVAVATARRYPLGGRTLLRHLPVHLLAAFGCAFVYLAVWALWTKLALPSYGAEPLAGLFWGIFRARFNVAFLLYWGVVGGYLALWNFRRLQAQEAETVRARVDAARAREAARAELARARLGALRSQLQPHFLFNTLHSIASLVEGDPPAARRLIARLGELLRTTLDVGETLEVPLSGELEFLEQYLEIERVRFGARLRVRYEIADDARDGLVPPLLLQPIVENAVRHGIAPLEEGGTIVLRGWREADRLCLEVSDTGPGFGGPGRGDGIGLRNTRERLEHTYGPEHTLAIRDGEDGGASIEIRLPYRRDDPAADARKEPGPS